MYEVHFDCLNSEMEALAPIDVESWNENYTKNVRTKIMKILFTVHTLIREGRIREAGNRGQEEPLTKI